MGTILVIAVAAVFCYITVFAVGGEELVNTINTED